MKGFKEIHIGSLVNLAVKESEITSSHICKYLNCSEKDLCELYEGKDFNTGTLLKLSKLLGYDFFRIYSQHLILFSPSFANNRHEAKSNKSELPKFRKNIYTKEVIDFIIELVETGMKTKLQIMEEYKIPKTTLYKWIEKYKK